jgi:hypothetical protein
MQTIVFHEAEHVYYFEERRLDGVTSVLSAAGMTDYRNDPRREEWLYRGSCVHAAAKLIATKQWSDPDIYEYCHQAPDYAPFIQCANRWLETSGFKVCMAEVFVFDPALGLAGQIDLLGTMGNLYLLPDWKCSAADRSTALQTIAYLRMLKCLLEEIRILIVDGPVGNWTVLRDYIQPAYEHAAREHLRCALELYKTGKDVKPVWYDDVQDFETFMAALTCARWIQQGKTNGK